MKTSTALGVAESIKASVSDDCVLITVSGDLNRAVNDEAQAMSLEWLKQTGLRRLMLDFRSANLTEGAVGLLKRVKIAYEHPEFRDARTVMLCKAMTSSYVMLELAARSQGFDFKISTDGETAWHWLKEPLPD